MNDSLLVMDVDDPGQDAMVVRTSGPKLLLLDSELEHE